MVAATVLACGFTAACHSASHPDDKQAVYETLKQNDLASVTVDQDRGKGVIKLTGIVGNQERKDRAQELAQQAAPGYQVDNELTVDQTNILTSPSTPAGNKPNPTDNRTASAVVKAKPQK
jgi:osmotically-inducible protein OsmY